MVTTYVKHSYFQFSTKNNYGTLHSYRDRSETIGPPSKATVRRAFSLQTGVRGLFGKLCMHSKKNRGEEASRQKETVWSKKRERVQGTKSCGCSEPPTDVCSSCVGGNQDFCLIQTLDL